MKKCPCKQCICMPVCRCKDYHILVNSCHIVKVKLFYRGKVDNKFRRRWFSRAIVDMEKYLKPILWHIYVENDGYARVIRETRNENTL